MMRSSSLRPEPASPAMPTTSPARTSNVTSAMRRPVSPSAASTTGPGTTRGSQWGNTASMGRPAIAVMTAGTVVSATTPRRPSDRCAGSCSRWAIRNTSSSRWDTYRMATPRPRSRSMAANSSAVSASVSAAVGSSRMSSGDSCESARASAVIVLLDRRQPLHVLAHVDVLAQAREQLPCGPVQLTPAHDPSARRRVATQEHVLRDAEARHRGQLLEQG